MANKHNETPKADIESTESKPAISEKNKTVCEVPPRTKDDERIIIEGVTDKGETFRPSDWAERMSGNLSTFRNHRIYYSPLLQPGIKNGNKCVILDASLKESNPALYQSILDFAHTNNLRICKDDEK